MNGEGSEIERVQLIQALMREIASGEMNGAADAATQPARATAVLEPPPAVPPVPIIPAEAPPQGIPAEYFDALEDGPDLATVVAEMTALKQEVKLQARTFKKLQETMQTFAGDAETGAAPPFLIKLAAALSQAVDAGFQKGVERAAETIDERRREAGAELDEARDEGFMQAAEALMDARDRLAFGLDQARATLAAFTGWRAWLGGRDVLLAGLKGQEMALARLDDELKKMDFEPLATVGGAFDAEQMRAVEAVAAPHTPVGTVLAVLRQGYARGERSLRIADVRVAKGTEPRA